MRGIPFPEETEPMDFGGDGEKKDFKIELDGGELRLEEFGLDFWAVWLSRGDTTAANERPSVLGGRRRRRSSGGRRGRKRGRWGRRGSKRGRWDRHVTRLGGVGTQSDFDLGNCKKRTGGRLERTVTTEKGEKRMKTQLQKRCPMPKSKNKSLGGKIQTLGKSNTEMRMGKEQQQKKKEKISALSWKRGLEKEKQRPKTEKKGKRRTHSCRRRRLSRQQQNQKKQTER